MFSSKTPDWIRVRAGLGLMVLLDLENGLPVAKPWTTYHKMKDVRLGSGFMMQSAFKLTLKSECMCWRASACPKWYLYLHCFALSFICSVNGLVAYYQMI